MRERFNGQQRRRLDGSQFRVFALCVAMTLWLCPAKLFGYGSADHARIPSLLIRMPQLREPIRRMIRENMEYAIIGALLQDSGNLRGAELERCAGPDGTLDPGKVAEILRKRKHPVKKIADEIAKWGLAGQWPWMSSHNPLTPDWYVDSIRGALREGNAEKAAFLCGAVTHLSECLVGYHGRAMAGHGRTGKKYRREIDMAGRPPVTDFDAALKRAIETLTSDELDEDLGAWYRDYIGRRCAEWYPKVLRWRIEDQDARTPEHFRRRGELGLFESSHVLKFCVKVCNQAVEAARQDRLNGADVLLVVHTGLRDGANLSYLSLMAKNGISYEFRAATTVQDMSRYKAVVVLAGMYLKGMDDFFRALGAYAHNGGRIVLVGEPAFGSESAAPREFAFLKDSPNVKWTGRGVDKRYENHVFIMDALRGFWGEGRISTDAAETSRTLCALAEEFREKVGFRHVAPQARLSDADRRRANVIFDFVDRLAGLSGGWIDLAGTRVERKIPFDMRKLVSRDIDGRPIIKPVSGDACGEVPLPGATKPWRGVLFESARRTVFLAAKIRLPRDASRIALSFSYRIWENRGGTRRLQLFMRCAGTRRCLLDERIRDNRSEAGSVKAYSFDLTAWAGREIELEFDLRNVGVYAYRGTSVLGEPRILVVE